MRLLGAHGSELDVNWGCSMIRKKVPPLELIRWGEPNRDKVTPIPWERWFCHLSVKLTLAHLFLFLNLNFFLIESIKRVVSAFLSQLLWGWDELILWQCSTLRQVLCKCEPELSVRGDHCSSDPLCPSGALIPNGEGVLFPLNVFWMSWEFPDSQGGAFGFW